MKRILLFWVLLVLPISAAAQNEDLVDPDPKGYASQIFGQVMILEPEAGQPGILSDSDPVFEGCRITAAENSFAEIHLIDGSVVKVDEMSQIDVSNLSVNDETLQRTADLSILYGSLRVSVPGGFSEGSSFKITTPVAVAGVRGTDFAVSYESEQEADVDVFEGEVGVQADGAEESVSEGEAVAAGKGRKFQRKNLAERKERWEQHREAMDLHGKDRAAAHLKEKIEKIRAENPNDPRLAGLENAFQNVSQHREEAKARFAQAREKMKDRREERLARMKEFAQKHGREKFDRERKFRGGKLTDEQRKEAAKRIHERRENRKEQFKEKNTDRKDKREEFRERRQDRRENRGEKQKPRGQKRELRRK